MNQYLASYTLPYRHGVTVGIRAESEDQALHIARVAFEDGSIWDDTEAMPLLYDDFEEDGCNAGPLEFEIVETDGPFIRSSSVIRQRQQAMAFSVCQKLIAAYGACGLEADGGKAQFEWDAIDAIMRLAVDAVRPRSLELTHS